jgi:DNA-binding CsgD family transcriptional regulator/tetratricopeptide (TPR) repeat protein
MSAPPGETVPTDRAAPTWEGERRFIGRQGELQTLQRALHRAVSGQPGICLLAGEPGIGKTRTAQQMVDLAARHGVLALWGRCPEELGAPPYWPWVQLIRRYVALHEAADLAVVFGPAAAPMASLDPQFARHLPDGLPPPIEADAAQARFRLFDAIAGFWQRAAARQPLLLVFDDLHRADMPSLRLLEFVMAEAGSNRMLVMGTYRDAEVTLQHPLTEVLVQLHRHARVQRLLLGGFTATETAEYVAAAGLVAPELGSLMHEQTEGHPLFLAEMVREMLPSGAGEVPASHGARSALRRVPKGVREVIGARVNRLTAPCLELLQHVAVAGRQFSADHLGLWRSGLTADQCVAWLHEACAASLIEEAADTGSWQFTHVLVRDTLYDELPAARRAELHREVAEALERQHADDLTPALSALAHHWHAAGSAGDSAKAIDYATRAAQRATAMLAHEEAVRHYRLASDAVPATADHDARRCRLLLGLGEAQNSAGDSAGALATFARAATHARRLGDAGAFASAAIGFGNAVWRQGIEGTQAVTLLKEALSLAAPADNRERVGLLSALCRALLFASRPQEAEQVSRDAIAVARRLGDPQALYEALSAIVSGRWYPEGLALRIEAAREGIELTRHAPHLPWPHSTFLGWHTGDLMESGDSVAALATARLHLEHARSVGEPFNEATALAAQAMIATHQGRFGDGEQLAQQALRCGERFDRANAAGIFGVQMFTLRRHQGRLGELAPVLQQFLDRGSLDTTWRPGLAILHCELGARDEAQRVFDTLAGDDFNGIPNDAIRIASLAYLAEVCAWLGDTRRAPTLQNALRPYAQRCIVFGAHTASLGSAARLLGLLAATLEQWDAAQQHFEFALGFDERSGGPPWLARTRCDYATALLQRHGSGDSDLAHTLAAAALEEARSLGLRGIEERALALERQLAAGAGSPGRTAGLSSREVQVLRLVASGKTNQEIAAVLCRSPATVAIHVRNILGKTQSANRAEAAAFAARHGLLASEQGLIRSD